MKLRKIQDIKLKGKTVLMRVDHNVVKKGKIKDPYRIDVSLQTIKYILENDAKLLLMSHVGRPRNKKTGEITIDENTSVRPIVEYLRKRGLNFATPRITETGKLGLQKMPNIAELQIKLNSGKLDGIYFPNTRWFAGEESGDESSENLAKEMAELADIFVNDAFGSWQPHVSTYQITKELPSYAGLLMQKEIDNLQRVLNPKKPMLAVVAGSKFDTKIGPLSAILKKADKVILGGVLYNAYLCAKYKVKIKGIVQEDIKAAQEFVKLTEKYPQKMIELPYIVESEEMEERDENKNRIVNVDNLQKGRQLQFVLDAAEQNFTEPKIKTAIQEAQTIFVNAVMGYTPNYPKGTIALNKAIDANKEADKFFGGGDTLQEFKNLLPEIYENALENTKYYFFTGGGTILKAIEADSPFGLQPVKALLE
ncbi:MAG: phosphoglycerate kinase [Candidatus Cloacimonadota bacterium]|nr:phosphoglycerate kinase [Candidatus Cloacimonadota bacterium]